VQPSDLHGPAVAQVIGLASGDDRCPEQSFCIQFSARDKAAFVGFALGGVGLVVGGLLGVLVGSHDVYELDSASVPRVSAMLAPGLTGGGLSWSF
jgi:hypothetical protein